MMIPSHLVASARRVLLALAALSVFATGAAAQAGVAPDTARPPEPPLSAVLDSAGLVAKLANLSLPDLPDRVPPLFWIEFDSTGAVDTVEAMFDQIPAAYAKPVAALIRAHLKPQAPSREPLTTHVRVVAGPAARVDRPRLREEWPVLLNRSDVARQLQRAMGGFLAARDSVEVEYRAHIKMRVLADSTPDAASVKITRSTGEAELDSAAVRIARRMRFRPATIEEIPVRVWVELPILFMNSDAVRRAAYAPPPPPPAGPFFGVVVEAAGEFGGDPVATVLFDDGTEQDVQGGRGVSLAVGGLFRPSWTSPLGLRATVGFKYATTAADNAHIRLTRVPIELVGTYRIDRDFWVGAGFVRHAMVRFRGDDLGPDLDFADANGATVELGWKGLALTYTALRYTDAAENDYDASSLGLILTHAFGLR